MPADLRVNHSHGLLNGAGSTIIINQTTGAVTITPVSGQGLTLAAGDLIFSTAITQIVPGATSLSLRNNADTADNIIITDAGVATVRAGLVVTTGNTFLGDTANTGMTLGLTINQGGADDEVLAFKSSDVAHGVTTVGETDSFAVFQKQGATTGGLMLRAVRGGSGTVALSLRGIAPDDASVKTTAGLGVVELVAQKISGTGVADVGADGNILHVRNNATTRLILDAEGHLKLNNDANGQGLELLTLTELTTIAAAATTSTTIQIPANAQVWAVSCRVTTVIPTATAFDIGITGATTRYGTGISVAADTSNPGANDGVRFYSSATAILITPNGTPADNSGRLRVTIHYVVFTAPTS